MPIVELNTVSGIGQYFNYQTFELQQFFFGHVMFLVKDQPNAMRAEHGRACLCRA